MSIKLHRRSFLKGIGGVAMALPALEIMGSSRAHAATPSTRFVLSYGGTSIGADFRDLSLVVPTTTGAGYAPTRALQPIADFGMQNEMSVVTGLMIPYSISDAAPIPLGGAAPHFHGNSSNPQLCGCHAGPDYTAPGNIGPSADQLVADVLAGPTKQRVLAYRVQAASYVDVGGNGTYSFGAMSFRKNAAGKIEPISAVYSPHQAFYSLFSGFLPNTADAAKVARAKALLMRRRSVVDLVRDNTIRLMSRLGHQDQMRMERHLDEIRGLENRLQQIQPPIGSACVQPMDPLDPPISGVGEYLNGSVHEFYDLKTTAYSNEDLRGDLLTDLITMAFACDFSRVANLWLTYTQCAMSMYQINGMVNTQHGFTHTSNAEGCADSTAWHIKQHARLAKKLKNTLETDGTSLLDHTAMVLVFEGGNGNSADVGAFRAGQFSHSWENMMVVVSGRAGGLKPGKHIVGNGRHPAQAVLSAMNAAGYPSDTFGEVNGNIPELFV